MLTVNGTLNRINEWGQPTQHPMARFFLTRLDSIVCIAVESISVTYNTALALKHTSQAFTKLGARICLLIRPKSTALQNFYKRQPGLKTIKKDLSYIARLIVGIISTILTGTVLSPEINFRIHLKLGLAVDNVAIKREKDLKIQLDTKMRAEKITKERAERFAQFQAERQMALQTEADEYAVDARLAELLVTTSC